MLRNIIFIFFLFWCFSVYAQQSVDIRLKPSQESEKRVCYSIDVNHANGDEELMLAGQNYRFFYSSESLEFDESGWDLRLSDEEYTFKLVQHQNNVDASKIGILSFDKDLGFINASIILNGTNIRGAILQRNTWKTLAEMCFNIIEESSSKHVVVARPDYTSKYGRAYVELSYVDQDGFIQSLSINKANDIN